MMKNNLFVITATNPEAYQHYIDTIEEGFALDDICSLLEPEIYEKLKVIYGGEKIKAWGATPGEGNLRTWNKLAEGDRVLIYRVKNFEYFATVVSKIHNRVLAEKLWKSNSKGETWEYMYFLDDLTEISVPVEEFNKMVEFKENYTPQGFSCIKEDRQELLIKKYGSIDEFLVYLSGGKWLESTKLYTPEVKKEIIRERATRSVERTGILEANLEKFLSDRVDQIEDGLKLVSRQLDTGVVGRLDLLCEDKVGNLVVVELKKDKAGSSIMDQISRYMGWVIEHKAQPNQKVRGIIILGKKDTSLEYAVKSNPSIEVKIFSISFQ